MAFTWLLKCWVESRPAVSPFGTCVAIPCAHVLAFVVRSSISVAFVLVCSSVLSVPFPPSLGFGPFTGT